jgi:ribosome biogenesis protein MAK21
MYLNLVYRALKSDDSIPRIRAFVKRLCQTISIANVPLICGSLFLLSELFNQTPSLWTIVTEKEMKLNDNEIYDGKKRDPRYANADRSLLWELIPFTNHFHPTVSLYAKTILSGNSLVVPKDATNYDPLLNHTLARFLERFVFKAPKKVKSLHHGNSLMQPRGTTNLLVTGGRRKQNAIYEDLENDGALTALDDAPVNLKKWSSENEVAADEVFLFCSAVLSFSLVLLLQIF